jgi:phasin
MANAPYEIPNELRDFAERSVDQARKAFEGFVTVAQKTAGTVDGAAHEAQNGAKQVSSQILGFAEKNVNAAFDLAQKLVHVKDPQEAFALQSEFLKTQIDALQNQAKELGALIQKGAASSTK